MNVKTTNNTHYALLAGIHLTVVPLYFSISSYVLLLFVCLSLMKLYLIKYNKKDPSKFFQILIVIVTVYIIFSAYGKLFGQQSGISLIALMTTLKLFEIKTNRDSYIVVYSSFFIIASTFFYSQSVWLFIYVFIVVLFLITILISLSDRLKTTSFKDRAGISAQFIVAAVPLMIILFFLFPRLPGPLWALPTDALSGKTMISEEMSPGSINRLISSSAIAFRVRFEDEVPVQADRYWRGAVLSSYDGETWRRDDASIKAQPNIVFNSDHSNEIQYQVTLEPTNLKWLIALEYPNDFDTPFRYNREAMLVSSKPLDNVISYNVSSQTTALNKSLFPQESYKNRLLPVELNSKTVKFAQQLMASSGFDENKYINNVLAYFRSNNFVYTLSPDLLGKNAMDDFLFKSQKGFCEHYASAFVYLVRAAGIPARVVIGYQGGEMNPLDDYMIVRQSDAHAWSEVWLNNRWLRVDPTAAVSPERVEQGILNAGLEQSKLPLILISNSAVIKNISYLYDSFQNSWNNYIVGFNQKKQQDLLAYIGFDDIDASDHILLLVALMSVMGLFIAWGFLKKVTVSNDRVQHYYDLYCQKFARFDVRRRLNEGPQDFESRIYKELSLSDETRSNMAFIFKAYSTLHYGNNANVGLRKRYCKKIKSFKLVKQKKL